MPNPFKMQSPIKYYGGKARMVPHLLPMEPPHRQFLESHAGGLSYFFAKKPSMMEVVNDTNENVANFYRVLIRQFDELLEMVHTTMHCEATFLSCKRIYHGDVEADPVTRAWALWVVSVMAFGGEVGGSFQWARNNTDAWHPAVSIRNRRRKFEHYRKRMELVTVRCRPAAQLIREMDCPDLFVYSDPPYVGARQGHYSGYTVEDFAELLEAHESQRGKFMLSSYDHPLLSEFVERNGWQQFRFNKRLEVTGGTQRKTEVVTINYQLEKKPKPIQLGFFS